jgi:FAD synthetase
MSMNNKILNLDQTINICKKLHNNHKTLVLAGGVFDLLHYGHLMFLKAAKKEGDILIVALECDKNVKRKKGTGRPIHNENIRAEMLAALDCVDYVLILPEMSSYDDYAYLVKSLRPNTIAVTKNDPQIENKQKQAISIGGECKIVINPVSTPSTSQLLKILEIE